MPTITLGNGKQFQIDDGETILEGVLRQGAILDHSCNTGRCGACKSAILAGHSEAVCAETGLTDEERAENVVLLCARKALGDVAVAMSDIGGDPLPPRRIVPCRIQALDRISEDVMRVVLRLPPKDGLLFFPGQYVNVSQRGGPRRSYSIANAPRADGTLDLYIRLVPGGAMSAYWFSRARVNDLLQLVGPMGAFFLRESQAPTMIMLATGTGMAPIKAILEMLAQRDGVGQPQRIHMFWGGRTPEDFYWNPKETGLELAFTPVLSRPDANWSGATGYVQDAVLKSGFDLAQCVVYACGSPAMIESARDRLSQARLAPKNFHSDAFVASTIS